jgi:SAM-dependent methyltransferase
LWEAWTDIHTAGEFYDVGSFVDGSNPVRIEPWEQAEVGDVRGKSLLHVQCHFGLDSLSWVRLGAEVTGVDFSPKALAAARELAERTGLEARFLESSVYDLPDMLEEEFDVVYTSRGVLGWLPSVERWAEVVAGYVKPGGFLYLHEIHPVMQALDDERASSNPVHLRYDYWEGDVLTFEVEGTYADPTAEVDAEWEHGWNHGLGEIVSAVAGRGLRVDFLHEHRWLDWPLDLLEEKGNGTYGWPDDQEGSLPLMFSLRASRPA